MNLLWKIILGVLFWELVDGCDEVPDVEEFEDFDFDEMEWD